MHSLFTAKSPQAPRQGTCPRYAGGRLTRPEMISVVMRSELITGLELMHEPCRTWSIGSGRQYVRRVGGRPTVATLVLWTNGTPRGNSTLSRGNLASPLYTRFIKNPHLTAEPTAQWMVLTVQSVCLWRSLGAAMECALYTVKCHSGHWLAHSLLISKSLVGVSSCPLESHFVLSR